MGDPFIRERFAEKIRFLKYIEGMKVAYTFSAIWVVGLLFFSAANACAMDLPPKTITLPKPRLDGGISVERALQQRRSIRNFSESPLTLPEVSQLLWSAQGTTSETRYRTAPSAGALYALEIILVVGKVHNLETGVYKYLPITHQLALMDKEDKRPELAAAALDQDWIRKNAALLVFSAVEKRTTQKYGNRGIRYVHIEVGHAAQNVFLQAQSLGLGAAVVGAFDDEQTRKILNLSKDHHILYLMPVGRPDNRR